MQMEKPRNTREHIILELKRAGTLSTKELAEVMEISGTAVRQVLNGLQAENLVDAEPERLAQGRPHYIYSLTQKGHELFPGAYDTLAKELLETVRELGGEDMVRELMEKQIEKKEERYRLLVTGRSLLEKLVQLHALREEDGYMPEVVDKKGDPVELREYNCPIFRIAKDHPQLCTHEHELMERLLGRNLELTHHMLAGEHFCCFEVSEEETAPLTIETPER
jgi:DeoR family transcriptional regulator, suf operon transcriptional repressor